MTPPPPPTKQFALKANGHPTLIYISNNEPLIARSDDSEDERT